MTRAIGIMGAALLLASAACEMDSFSVGEANEQGSGGSGTSQGNGGDALMCEPGGDSCTQCEFGACKDDYCECFGNQACIDYALCIFNCPFNDGGCLQSCNETYPDGISDAVLLNDCAAKQCESPCTGYPLYEISSCQSCLHEHCEDTMNACIASEACGALLSCVGGCGNNDACTTSCVENHPGGAEAAQALAECAETPCGGLCSDGG